MANRSLPANACLLCGAEDADPFVHAHGRPHFSCRECGLIFVPPEHHPDAQAERERYETHNNDPGDERYRAFLDQVAKPLYERLPAGAEGLDYGSGPGPTLSVMMEEQGHDVAIYDPFFAPQADVLGRQYDFITCTETAEHFHEPSSEFERFDAMLRAGGWLGIMTQWADGRDFERWSYARDETHVCFYRAETMQWIAEHFGWRLNVPGHNVALFQKPA